MNTLLSTSAAVESVRQASGSGDAPDPAWVRGVCPQCGSLLVSNCYYVGGRGYLIVHECWESLGDAAACAYRKII